MATTSIGTNNVITISGNDAQTAFQALYAACGKPPIVKSENKEQGFIYQGFYVRYFAQI